MLQCLRKYVSKIIEMATKNRKYLDHCIKFRFVSLLKGDTEVPQCVICYKTCSNEAMRLSRFKRHLTTAHSVLADKSQAFFVIKCYSLKKAKLDMSGAFQQRSSKVVEVSYEITMLIAKNKKIHDIGESHVKPRIIAAADNRGRKTGNYRSREARHKKD